MNAIAADKVIVELQAKIDRYNADVARSQQAFERSMDKISRSALRAEAQVRRSSLGMSGALKGLVTGFAAGVAGGFSIDALQKLIDTSTRIQNALKVAGLSGLELKKVYDQLYQSAQRNAAPFETLVTLYSRAALQQKELRASSDDLIKFVDNISKALRVAGTDPQAASGALLQLSQALGSGTVRAEEFNSVMEGAPAIAQAAARGIKEAGGSVSQLRSLVIDGKVSSRAFFDGFQAGAVELDAKLEGTAATFSQGFERIKTALIDTAGRFNTTTELSARLGNVMQQMADAINNIQFDSFLQKIDAVTAYLNAANAAAQNFGAALGKKLGTDVVGEYLLDNPVARYLGAPSSNRTMAKRFGEDVQAPEANAVIDAWVKKNYGDTVSTPKTDRLAGSSTVAPISLANYPVTGKKKKGGSKAIKKTADDAFNEDVDDIKKRTAALLEEQNTLRLSYFEQEKRKVSLELEQKALDSVREAARKKGDKDWQNVQLSEQQRQKIDEVSEAYARQADSLRQATELYDLQKDILKGAFSDIRSALEDGKITAEEWGDVFMNVLDKIIDKIEDELVNSILSASGGLSGGGGLLGGLLSLFGFKNGGPVKLATGGFVSGPGGPRSDRVPAMLSNGEYVVNAAATKKFGPLLDAINNGKPLRFADGGLVNVPHIPSLQSPATAQRQEITLHLVGEEGELFTPRVTQISGQTAGVVVKQSRPLLARDAVNSVQAASRNRPGLFR